jgi:hypothetical protein
VIAAHAYAALGVRAEDTRGTPALVDGALVLCGIELCGKIRKLFHSPWALALGLGPRAFTTS